MPTPLQKRVLQALESGRKLHELLREPSMPSKAMVEEWRDNPEFEADYLLAVDAGAAKRSPAPAEPEKRRKSVNRCPFTCRGQPATIAGSSDDARRVALSQWITRLLGDGDTYVTPPGRPAQDADPILAPITREAMPAKTVESEVKQEALAKLRAGLPSGQVLKETRGLDAVKLAAWRKAPAFAAEWDEAKAAGRIAAGRPAKATAPKPTMAIVAPAKPEQLAVVARPALGIMPRKLWQEQVEQERLAALRNAIIRYLDNGDALPSDWVEEYNELTSRPALAA